MQIQLNWLPEAEHGGYFHALATGMFKEAGLGVKILNGGPGVPVETEVALGRVQFGIANADKILSVRSNGLDVIALLAPFQISPRCLMSHKEDGIQSFKDLSKSKRLILNNTKPFYHFLTHKFPELKNVETIPYQQAVFLTQRGSVMQGYINSEPLIFEKKDVQVSVLKLSDLGFNPYASVLICSRDLLIKDPVLVKTMVEVTRKAWLKYLEDPEFGNREILKRNKDMKDIIGESSHALKPLMKSSKPKDKFGSMSKKRWVELSQQLREIGVLKREVLKYDFFYND